MVEKQHLAPLHTFALCRALSINKRGLGWVRLSQGLNWQTRIQTTPFISLEKHYSRHDLLPLDEDFERTHIPCHDNPNIHIDVVNRFAGQPYHVPVIKWSVPESFTQGLPDAIAFAHIDMNHPDPEKAALTNVLLRLSPSGCIIFDDYGWLGCSAHKCFTPNRRIWKFLNYPLDKDY